MSRFISDKIERIKLSDGEWVDARESLSYKEMLPITSKIDEKNPMSNMEIALPLLNVAIKGWNLEKDGEVMEVNSQSIDLLDTATVVFLVERLSEIYFPSKKD